MEKLITINKPKNWTSNDVIKKLKKELAIKKIGHGGTLDPLATGVLVVGINDGTKMLTQKLNDIKKYIAKIEFGYQTTTYDLEGKIISQSKPNFTESEMINILNNWKQEYWQQPPIYSAIKKNGKALYKYARANQEIQIEKRLTKILDYNIISFSNNILEIEITVPKGFYVRSLANDLGIALKTYGTIIDLIRTQSGEHLLEDCYELMDFINEFKNI